MDNEFNEKEFIEEVLKQAKDYLNNTLTVEEAISNRKEELSSIKESFEALWKAYGIVSSGRNQEVQTFKTAKIRMYLYAMLVKLLSAFNREGAYEEIMGIHDNISLSLDDLKKEKELLICIRNAIKELEKYQVADCNYDISLLLSFINDKNSVMFDILKEDINSVSLRMKGYGYSSNSNKREELKDLNENIEYKSNELKLVPNKKS